MISHTLSSGAEIIKLCLFLGFVAAGKKSPVTFDLDLYLKYPCPSVDCYCQLLQTLMFWFKVVRLVSVFPTLCDSAG